MKKLMLTIMLLVTAFAARAQYVPVTANLTAQDSGPCTTANACVLMNVATNYQSGVIQLSGTWSGTVQFEATTTAAGGQYTPISGYPVSGGNAATSSTATGAWRFNLGSVGVLRVRVSTYTSGTIVAAITGSTAWSEIAPGLIGGTGGGGGAVSSITGDGTVECGSGLTGAVTLPVCNAPINSVLAGPPTGSPGAPTYQTLPVVNIAGNSSTSTALAATPTQCTGSNVAQGVTAAGNANCISPPGGPPSGTAGGDLGGTYPNPTVVNLSHVTNSSLPNSGLVNPSVTVNGQLCTLGSSCALTGTRRTCMIVIGAENAASALANADLGPQNNQCKVAQASTIQEVTLSVDNASSTTSIQVRKRHCATFSSGNCATFTLTNLLSAVLSAASVADADACAMSATSQTCIDGTTSSGSVTVSTTAIAAGDWLEMTSGTADGTTKRASVSMTYTVN